MALAITQTRNLLEICWTIASSLSLREHLHSSNKAKAHPKQLIFHERLKLANERQCWAFGRNCVAICRLIIASHKRQPCAFNASWRTGHLSLLTVQLVKRVEIISHFNYLGPVQISV